MRAVSTNSADTPSMTDSRTLGGRAAVSPAWPGGGGAAACACALALPVTRSALLLLPSCSVLPCILPLSRTASAAKPDARAAAGSATKGDDRAQRHRTAAACLREHRRRSAVRIEVISRPSGDAAPGPRDIWPASANCAACVTTFDPLVDAS